MRFVPNSVTRMVTDQALTVRKHSPEILFVAGVASMVGSTVLACRATLKLEHVLNEVEVDKAKAARAKDLVDSGKVAEGTTYTDDEMSRDLHIIKVRGAVRVAKLYAPPVILGGIGILCLTKSHSILKERNVALTAAYVAVDTAFRRYRQRVVERFGDEVDREIRYEAEEVDIIDDETGKLLSTVRVSPADHSGYARWFDEENANWNAPPFERSNAVFLRHQQNWANDMLMSRGHVFLNEVYSLLGLPQTSAGAIVGWVYERGNEDGDNYIDFGCWDRDSTLLDFFNGRDGAILLDFNVDGPIWDLLDERNRQKELENERLKEIEES